MATSDLDEVMKALLASGKTPEEMFAKGGLLDEVRKRLAEAALNGELDAHLGYEKHATEGRGSGNARNGSSRKRVKHAAGEFEVAVPRDRAGTFEPQLIKKHQRRMPDFDNKVIALYAAGMSVREIQSHLKDFYGAEASPALISQVTAAVLDDIRAWQGRPLDAVYPFVWLDALFAKSRETGVVEHTAVYLALGVNLQGEKVLLGMWQARSEGAKFWMTVLAELQQRGVKDILVASVDGLSGFEEAIHSIYPQTRVQACVVHQVRHSLSYVSWKDRKAVAADLRRVYTAASIPEAELALGQVEAIWGERYPRLTVGWRRNWTSLTTYFDFPPAIRKVIYTTNAIESLNRSLRRVLKTRGAFPNDEALMKVMYLALQRAAQRWTKPVHDWKAALNQLTVLFGDRVPHAALDA